MIACLVAGDGGYFVERIIGDGRAQVKIHNAAFAVYNRKFAVWRETKLRRGFLGEIQRDIRRTAFFIRA